jgi:integron integrase
MGKLSKDRYELLPEFQKFLLERKLAPEKNIPFLAYWVSRYLTFGRKRDISTDDYNEFAALEFLEMLRADEKILEWQPRQADDAIKLYYFHFLGKSAGAISTASSADEIPDAVTEVKRLIRLRHYSYSTERTYLHWIERFFSYALTGEKRLSDLSTSEFRDFLSHLAMKQRVSASTQNQALNAIVFVYRHVLDRDIEDEINSVRVRQRRRLPVVLTVKEVNNVFDEMSGLQRLMAMLIYGCGLRLQECLNLRIKDVDIEQGIVIVRSGKGDKDRRTILPESLKDELVHHISSVRELYEQDRKDKANGVYLPGALEKKYPNAGKEWGWFWLFPSRVVSIDALSGVITPILLLCRGLLRMLS